MGDMLRSSSAIANDLGVELVDVRVKQVEFPDDVRNAVYQQMREERARRAEGRQTAEEMTSTADKERTIILADAYRDGQVLRGEGDALSADIYATAYQQDPEFYAFYGQGRRYSCYRSGQ